MNNKKLKSTPLKEIILFVFIIFVLTFIFNLNSIKAEEFTYVQKNNTFYSYTYHSQDIIPFSDIDAIDICLRKSDKTSNKSTYNIPSKITILQGDCSEHFLFNIIKYLKFKEHNIKIVYNKSHINSTGLIFNLSQKLNLSIYETGESNISSDILFIGDSDKLKLKENNTEIYELKTNNSLIKVNEEANNTYIVINGNKTRDTFRALKTLLDFYNKNFKEDECMLMKGCEPFLKIPEKEVNNLIREWKSKKYGLEQTMIHINKWINQKDFFKY